MNKKWWCLFGVHEYKIIEKGSCKKRYEGYLINGMYHTLQCQCCGKVKVKVN